MKSMPDGRLIPTPGDTIALGKPGFEEHSTKIKATLRKFNCVVASPDERRYGCYWVSAANGEEYVVSADVSGLRSRTFVVCSGGS